MKKTAWMLAAVVMIFTAAGCAQKTDSEKAMDQMKRDANKAANQMKKDINNL
jgi:hypothetical protein